MKSEPRLTINKLIKDRYKDARTVFWAGSVSRNEGNKHSDLDLIIIYEKLPNPYREAYLYNEWPIDAFVHDPDTLNYFYEESQKESGISGLLSMVLNGEEITTPSDFSKNLKLIAQCYFQEGPTVWNQDQLNTKRFLITDKLQDINDPKSRATQIAATASLYEALAEFYFRAQNKWSASGKSIVDYLERDNPDLALLFTQAFAKVLASGEVADLNNLVMKVLEPYGGFLWDGFQSKAPIHARSV